jgi:proteasome lid subunit RPN8/RPN11
MLTLCNKWKDIIRAEAEAAYPDECCGVLIGRLDDAKTVDGVIPIHNAREKSEQFHRFTIESEDLLRAEHIAQSQKCDVLGFYHSHPDHPAFPSDYDREHALPFYSYVIAAVEKGSAKDVTSWELKADRSAFTQEDFEITDI